MSTPTNPLLLRHRRPLAPSQDEDIENNLTPPPPSSPSSSSPTPTKNATTLSPLPWDPYTHQLLTLLYHHTTPPLRALTLLVVKTTALALAISTVSRLVQKGAVEPVGEVWGVLALSSSSSTATTTTTTKGGMAAGVLVVGWGLCVLALWHGVIWGVLVLAAGVMGGDGDGVVDDDSGEGEEDGEGKKKERRWAGFGVMGRRIGVAVVLGVAFLALCARVGLASWGGRRGVLMVEGEGGG
ncbi:hypothetical protein DM02DRAFT_635842 [Periconia macrospinosa]|uniref:Uncharacterized protein n=1 Tax=Periconia macrospinosa TaxID=97972 RepID=A0A2V1D2K3_9PLEO|nr:hypothetical protein DM02DRAFT_635842 [Periconia macrospinosa]